MAAKLVGPSVEAQRFNSHEAGYVVSAGKQCAFDLFLSVVTSEEAEDPLARARAHVRAAANAGAEKVRVRSAMSDASVLEVTRATELTFKTEAGEVYVVERLTRPVSSFEHATIGGTRNMQPKRKGRARIGMPRQF